MSNADVISVSALTKSYGKNEVLRVDDLKIRRHKITGIIGPSGAGKSTLLRILNLLESQSQGSVLFFGNPVPKQSNELLQLRRRMTMVFQRPALLNRSVFDNIAFGLKARQMNKDVIEERVCAVLGRIGLAAQSRQKAKTLSGGEAQRVAFARAYVLQPEILFLDEPTANLDPANVQLLEKMIQDINKEYGTTVLMVTHNLFQAQRLCDDAVFLYQGQLIEAGEVKTIFHNSSREETRAFVEGRMIY